MPESKSAKVYRLPGNRISSQRETLSFCTLVSLWFGPSRINKQLLHVFPSLSDPTAVSTTIPNTIQSTSRERTRHPRWSHSYEGQIDCHRCLRTKVARQSWSRCRVVRATCFSSMPRAMLSLPSRSSKRSPVWLPKWPEPCRTSRPLMASSISWPFTRLRVRPRPWPTSMPSARAWLPTSSKCSSR